jgi:light-regulated signal transduction histidine kinase (bacteriophytochrome)/CheY-like chemotaxis protein
MDLDHQVDRSENDTPKAPSDAAASSTAESSTRPPPPQSQISTNDFSDAQQRHGELQSPTDVNQMSPGDTDRVFPIRSVVSVDPSSTPMPRKDRQDGYFQGAVGPRGSHTARGKVFTFQERTSPSGQGFRRGNPRLPTNHMDMIVSDGMESETTGNEGSVASRGGKDDADMHDLGDLVTTRFTHVVTEEGHAIITGREDKIEHCEDEPIHTPGAIQSFGLLIALQEEDGKYIVRIVSENSFDMIGHTPKQLFDLESFTDILSEEQADNLLDHIDFVTDEETDVERNGPELFTLSIRNPKRKSIKFWCAMHINTANPGIIICELELENDTVNPPAPLDDQTPEIPLDTLGSDPTEEEFEDSTQNLSKPLRVLRSARRNRGEAAAMEVFNIMSQVQEQLASAPTLETFLKVLVGVVKELTGFHRVMIYQFDKTWNGRVVTELLDPRATKDLYKGLHFPASDIPKQARELYRINRVRLLYDRDQETARLVCRTVEDLEQPLDLTHSYLRAMSPIHIKYLSNMAVRASMSISINAFDELWGLISCHSYGATGMRVSFPIRKMCRLVGDTASRNIERLSYASRLQARKLINTVPTQHNPSGYIIASSEDLLKLFNADFGLLCIQDETKMLGNIEHSQEVLVMLEFLKVRKIKSVTTSQDIKEDFPDLNYPPGFQVLAGMLVVPLSASGNDFIAFFRRGHLREVNWAGNPYDKIIKSGTNSYLEPRKSFKVWSETVIGKCREWTEEEVETAAVLCLVYGKFIEVWRQKEAALQTSQLTKLLLANSAHEVRTPLNAIINYLEIALEGSLDQDTREYLAKSHSASKSLIYVINDLLDLTKTEEGVDLIRGDVFDFQQTFKEATEAYRNDAKRKNIQYNIIQAPGLPKKVFGDQRKVRQAVSNVIANAIRHTIVGAVNVEAYVASRNGSRVHIEVIVQDTGAGMSAKKLDALFRDLEQVQSDSPGDNIFDNQEGGEKAEKKEATLGLGLAIVARIVRNMNGQLRLKSEEGVGSRFVIQFPFEAPEGHDDEASGTETPTGTARTSFKGEGNEVLLVDPEKDNPNLTASPYQSTSRKNSHESLMSRKSVKSMDSNASGQSDVDRLIDALREPHMVDSSKRSSQGYGQPSSRPTLETRKTYGGPSTTSTTQSRSLPVPSLPTSSSIPETEPRGEIPINQSIAPLRAVRMDSDEGIPIVSADNPEAPSGIMGEVIEKPDHMIADTKPSPDNMRVLVAEDDPVNSRIVKKRLEKLGHEVSLTVNGEDCAAAYSENPSKYDVVLMDMQVSQYCYFDEHND